MSAKINLNELVLQTKDGEIFFENYSYESKDRDGAVYIMLEVMNASMTRAKQIGKTIFDTVKDYYFEDNGMSGYENFENALKEVNAGLEKVMGTGEKKARINAIVAVLSGAELHLTQTGYAEGYLVRGGTFSNISEGLYLPENEEEIFQNIASGLLEEEDRLVFSSERLLRFASQGELIKIFTMDNDDAIAEIRDIVTLEGVENLNLMVGAIKDLPAEEVQKIEAEKSSPISPIVNKIQELSRLIEDKGISRNNILGGIGVIVLVLIISVWVMGMTQQSQVDKQLLESSIAQIQSDIDNAGRLGLLEKREEAGAILNRAEEDLKNLLNSNPGEYREALAVLLEELDTEKDAIDNITRLKDAVSTVDLSTVRSGVSAVGMITTADDRRFVFDQNALYETILTEVNEPLTIDPNVNVIAGADFEEYDALVFYTQNSGLMEYSDGLFNFANTSDEAGWKPGIAIDTYSKYVYVLDPSEGELGQIWKYERTRSGYQAPIAYSVDADLTQAKDLTIDGSIWVVDSMGNIFKIYKGEKQEITVEDTPSEGLNNPNKVFTTAEMKNLYVLDQANQRVVSYYKSISNPNLIEYVNQYTYEDLGLDVRDIFVNNSEQKIYLLTADQILEFNISAA